MDPTFLIDHWLALVMLVAALGFGVATVLRGLRDGQWRWRLYLPTLLLGAFALGALEFGFLPWWLGPAFAAGAFTVLVFLLILVILTGFWNAIPGYALAGCLFFGLGSVIGPPAAAGINAGAIFLTSLSPLEPSWLLLLLLAPLLVWTSFRNLLSLGSTRRLVVIGLRCSLIVFLAFALSEMHARKPSDNTTVLFVWDRSLSMPPEHEAGEDLRDKRILNFINQSVSLRPSKHANDRAGVIVFGKQAKLELPPSAVPKLGFKKVQSQLDRTYTDISAAIKLALASFPEGSGKRIVLISDGNENVGNAAEQARIAKQNGVQIDVVPIASRSQQQNEILVERIEAPPLTEKDSRLPIRIVVRSFHPQIVVARLNLRKLTFDPKANFGTDKDAPKTSMVVKLRQGLNVYYFQQGGAKEDTVHSYEANVVPLHVETPEGALVHKDLPGDRVDNNEARVCVISRGERAILILEPKLGDHRLLADRLRAVKSSLKIASMTPDQMRLLTKGEPERLATFLSKFDAVLFANIPADSLSEEEQKVFRSNVHDQGAGLIMIGGNQSFGAGGWQNTEIEKALPVNMELKAMKLEGKSGLVLMMHASEIAEGNAWQRKIAKLAVEKLSPMDMIGMIHYDHGFNGAAPGHRWHIPFQDIGGNRNRIMKLIETMDPGDMPDVDPAFQMSHKELTNPEYGLGTKHIIFISDGDHWDASFQMLQKIKAAKITCTTVCITSHGADEVKKMAAVARFTGGRDYFIKDAAELPRIYVKEARLVSQSFVHEDKKGFGPRVINQLGPTEGMTKPPPPLYGFVRTTPKDSSLVQVLMETPKIGQYKFPLVASWQYGLGKSVAFTSDARTLAQGSTFWDKDWANSDLYAKFWEQSVDFVLRPVETGKHLYLATEHKDGKIRVTIEAQELDKTPLTEVELKAGISSPTFKAKDDRKFELKFEQKNAGVYEAEFPADEVGAYFVNIQAKWKKDGNYVTDNIRAGVTIPYSPEFAEMESNPGLLEKLAEATGGKIYRDNAADLEEAASRAEVFRHVPLGHASLQTLWPWLVFLTALCLLLDVAVRRIAILPDAAWAKAVAIWSKLRGEAVEEPMAAYMERLKSRKAASVGEQEKKKAAVKFEAPTGDVKPVEVATVGPSAAPEKPKPKPQAPKEEQEDFATRLMRAKKKAAEERDREKPM